MSFNHVLGSFGLFSITAVLAAGCNSDENDNGGDNSASLEAACDSFAAAACERFNACVASAFVDSAYDCTSIQKRTCLGAETDKSSFAPGDVDTCTSGFRSASCDAITSGTVRCDFPPGSAANGAACKYDTDCESSFCAKGGNSCGTCAAVPDEGAACIQLGCGPDRTCNDGQKCVTPKKAGEACGASDSCLGGLDCVNGVCAAPADSAGAACDPEGKTAPRCNLLKALYCGEESKKCLALTPAGPNEPCGFVDGQVLACTLSYRCAVPQGQLSGTCVAKVDIGASCTQDDECKTGLSCTAGSCVDDSNRACP